MGEVIFPSIMVADYNIKGNNLTKPNRAINDNEAYCYQCSVCEEGFTHVADCVPERNNSRDGSDTVCARKLSTAPACLA